MRVADDGKSIDITFEEAIKMATLGFICVVNEDGKVVQITQADKMGDDADGQKE